MGNPTAIRDMFELYKEMIGLEVLFQEGSFAANHFRNIIMIAAMLREFDWAHDFLEGYHSRLQLPWRTGVYAYCKGYLLFASGQYAEAKRQLVAADFHDPEYKINQQMLFIRIYYETNDLDGIESVRDALKIFLHRNNTIPAASKASAHNFARFAVRLFHLRGLLLPQKGIDKLRKEMRACAQLRDRNWLYAKLAEITP
jgi:hypothetical protein